MSAINKNLIYSETEKAYVFKKFQDEELPDGGILSAEQKKRLAWEEIVLEFRQLLYRETIKNDWFASKTSPQGWERKRTEVFPLPSLSSF